MKNIKLCENKKNKNLLVVPEISNYGNLNIFFRYYLEYPKEFFIIMY